jgi:hypothetical protein
MFKFSLKIGKESLSLRKVTTLRTMKHTKTAGLKMCEEWRN